MDINVKHKALSLIPRQIVNTYNTNIYLLGTGKLHHYFQNCNTENTRMHGLI